MGRPNNLQRPHMEIRQRQPPHHFPRKINSTRNPMGSLRREHRKAMDKNNSKHNFIPNPSVDGRRTHGDHPERSFLREMRPNHNDPKRHRQRTTNRPHRSRPHRTRRIRNISHRTKGKRLRQLRITIPAWQPYRLEQQKCDQPNEPKETASPKHALLGGHKKDNSLCGNTQFCAFPTSEMLGGAGSRFSQ